MGIVQEGPKGEQYVPLTIGETGGGKDLTTLKSDPNWKRYLYTGDYDLHEVYSTVGGMRGGGQIAEASREKVNLLNRLNAGIAKNSENAGERVTRSGWAVLGKHGLHMEDKDAQHQRQAAKSGTGTWGQVRSAISRPGKN
ncbi:hypothetical protein NKH77_53615 [Streptomyces sp. M19]